jgi:hypothetical protein
MKRDFHSSCEGCPNFELSNEFADQNEALERAVRESSDLELVQEGFVGCMRNRNNTPADKMPEESSRECLADRPVPPKIIHKLLEVDGLTVYSRTYVDKVPELVGDLISGDALWISYSTLLDFNSRRQKASETVVDPSV